jgi:hypothetical protein
MVEGQALVWERLFSLARESDKAILKRQVGEVYSQNRNSWLVLNVF